MAYQSEIEKLEQRYHENPQQWFAALADSYRKAGDLDLAVEVVRGGLEKRPNYASGHIVLGRCLMDMQQIPEAAGAFQQVLELDAENIIALKSLGEIAEQQGDIAGARDWLSRLLEIDPMNDEARENLERLDEIPVAAPETAELLEEKPSIEPGAAWAAEAMADINRGTEEAAEVGADETVGEGPGESGGELEVAEDAVPKPAGDLTVEKTSWDDLHASPKPAEVSGSEGTADAEIDAAFPVHGATVEPVSGLVDASFQEPGPVEPVSGLLGSSEVVQGDSEDLDAGIVDSMAIAGEASAETTPDEEADVGSGPAAVEGGELKMAGDLEVVSFDDELSWGAGEHVSGAVTEEDIREAETHQEDLAPAVEFLGDPEAFGTKKQDSGGAESGDDGVYRSETPVGEVQPDLYAREAGMVGTPPEEGTEGVQETAGSEDVASPGPAAGGGDVGEEHDLPLIMPEGVQEAGAEYSAGGPHMEPVVTETMGDVYARQGLFEQARETYEKLLEQRPGDAVLEQKLAEVSGQVDSSIGERPSRFSVADTGGQSAVEYLQNLFGPGPVSQVGSAAPADDGISHSANADQLVGEPESPLQAAFGGQPAEPPGSPTIPASDEVSLSSVFGSETPTASASGAPPAPATSDEEANVSFDQFYGGDKEPDSSDGATPTEDEESDEGADDDFRNWLEGLKT